MRTAHGVVLGTACGHKGSVFATSRSYVGMAGLTAVCQDIVDRTDNIGAVTGVTVAGHTRKLGVGILLVRLPSKSVS